MIFTPDRLADAVAALEKGEPVDWQKLADLQALDLARLGRRFVEEAIERHEALDSAVENELKGSA